MGTEPLSIRLLGLPEISWQNKSFPLARRQARALLFYLAESLKPVPRQQLCFLFWPDIPDTQARKNLNRLVSYLHRELPLPEMLILQGDSIQLNPNLTWSDTSECEALMVNGECSKPERLIDLYRAPFLDGFYLSDHVEYDHWQTEKRQRYEMLFLSALSKEMNLALTVGNYQKAIESAQQYLKIDNLAESVHRTLIVSYAADGNRRAAQAQYEQMVIILEKELGVSPLPETVTAYRASLTGEVKAPHTVPSPSSWTILPSLDVPMVGRQAALSQLLNDHKSMYDGGVLLVSGEAGIGKSRLLKEFAMQDHRCVINGNAYPATQTIPFQPVIQALQVALPHRWLWQGIPPIWLAEISLILPDIAHYYPDLPQRVNLAPQQAQARLFEALTQVFLGLASNASPLLFCLDDLHWVDQMSLGWLQYLAPRLPKSHLIILGTYRSESKASLFEFQRVLTRFDLSHEIILNGLECSAVEELITVCGAASYVPSGWAAKLQQVTGGNPFFLLETLSEVVARGQVIDSERLPVTETVHAVIDSRLTRLSIVARQVLEACAVLAPRLEFELIGMASGRKEFELIEALDELTHHYYLKIENGSYLFRHDLIRQVVCSRLTQWRAQLLHKRAAVALKTMYKKGIEQESAQIADHYDQAGKADQALPYFYTAAQYAHKIYAFPTAVKYLERALELLPNSGQGDEFAVGLHELLGDCQANQGFLDSARQHYNQAIALLGVQDALHEAAILHKSAAAFLGEFAYEEAFPLLERALHLIGAQAEQETLAWQHAWLDVQLERMFLFYQKALPDRIDEISNQIRSTLEKVGTPRQQIRFLTGLNYAVVRKNRYCVSREVVESERNALDLARSVDDAILICERQFNTGILSLLHGDLEPAVEYLSAGLELARKLGLHPLELQCLVYLIAAYRRQDKLQEVGQLAPSCLEVARAVGQPNYIGAALAHQAWLAFRSGDDETAVELALQAVALWEKTQTYPFQWMALWLLLKIAISKKDLEAALRWAAALVHPIQQAQPEKIEALLHTALDASQQGEQENPARYLEAALDLAQLQGDL